MDLTFSRIKLSLKLWLKLLKWEKVIILQLLLMPRAWRVVLVCPHFVSEFGHYYKENISDVSPSFKKMNWYWHATRKEENMSSPVFFENRQKVH